MSVITRDLPHQQFATRLQNRKMLTQQILQTVLLTIIVLSSAFAVVYIKDLYRRMFIHYQDLQNQQNQLYVDWGKLLLEQSTWSTQARVQKIATDRLQMEAPPTKEIQMVD